MGEPQLALAPSSARDVLARMDAANAASCAALFDLLQVAVDMPDNTWHSEGARGPAALLAQRYGISVWKANRWLACARALRSLPQIAAAFRHGLISIDKVCELTRVARPGDDEQRLLRWALRVTVATIRARGDVLAKRDLEADQDAHDARYLRMWNISDAHIGIDGVLPADQGAILSSALDRMAKTMPGNDALDAKRADALVSLASATIAADPDPDRASIVVHAEMEVLERGGNARVEHGPVIGQHTLARLLCNARTQFVAEDHGNVIAISTMRRQIPDHLVRQVRHRDQGCVFPGCGAVAFTEAHHVRFWRHGGKTTLANLALLCTYHHRSVHEGGWSLSRDAGAPVWRRPDGRIHVGGPSP